MYEASPKSNLEKSVKPYDWSGINYDFWIAYVESFWDLFTVVTYWNSKAVD